MSDLPGTAVVSSGTSARTLGAKGLNGLEILLALCRGDAVLDMAELRLPSGLTSLLTMLRELPVMDGTLEERVCAFKHIKYLATAIMMPSVEGQDRFNLSDLMDESYAALIVTRQTDDRQMRVIVAMLVSFLTESGTNLRLRDILRREASFDSRAAESAGELTSVTSMPLRALIERLAKAGSKGFRDLNRAIVARDRVKNGAAKRARRAEIDAIVKDCDASPASWLQEPDDFSPKLVIAE